MIKLFKWHLQNYYLNECKRARGDEKNEYYKNGLESECKAEWRRERETGLSKRESVSKWLREGYSNIRIKSLFFL